MVGTSGRIGLRFLPPTPSARSLPDWICGVVCTSDENITLLWPAITSIIAGPPPLNAHVEEFHPGLSSNSEPPRCWKLPRPAGGPAELAGRLLRKRDQLLHVVDRQARIDHQHVRPRCQHRDRGEGLDRVIAALEVVDPGIDRVPDRDERNRIAVLGRVGGELGADHHAGAAAVVDDDLPSQPLAERCRDRPSHHVIAAAGHGRNDEPDRLGRILLRGGGRNRRHEHPAMSGSERMFGISCVLPNGDVSAGLVAPVVYWAFMPVSLTTFSHLSISDCHELAEFGLAHLHDLGAFLGELLQHQLGLLHRRDLLAQPVDDRLRHAGRRDDAPPVVRLVAGDAGFVDRRYVGQDRRCASRRRRRAPAACRTGSAAWSAPARRTSPCCGRRPRRSWPARRP